MTVQAALMGLAAGVLAWWAGGHLIDDGAAGALPLRLAATAAAAAIGLGGGWRGARHAGGELAWDGFHWSWQADSAPGASPIEAPQIMIDLDSWMLLRWRMPRGTRALAWHAARRGDDRAAWARLRAALYFRDPSTSPPSTPERPPS